MGCISGEEGGIRISSPLGDPGRVTKKDPLFSKSFSGGKDGLYLDSNLNLFFFRRGGRDSDIIPLGDPGRVTKKRPAFQQIFFRWKERALPRS